MLRWAVIFLVIALVAARVWIHGRRCGRGGNREIPVLYLPGGLPDFLHYRHNGRQKNAITQDRSVKTMWAWEAAEKKSARLPPG